MNDNREVLVTKIEELREELIKFERHNHSLPPDALNTLFSQLEGLRRYLKGTRC